MKIAIFGLGYVGLSNAVLLAQHNEVVAVDISAERVAMLNDRKSPIIDAELEEFLANRPLTLTATLDAKEALAGADYVLVATPTNYDVDTNKFDTSTVEDVVRTATEHAPEATIVIKSTIPVGFRPVLTPEGKRSSVLRLDAGPRAGYHRGRTGLGAQVPSRAVSQYYSERPRAP